MCIAYHAIICAAHGHIWLSGGGFIKMKVHTTKRKAFSVGLLLITLSLLAGVVSAIPNLMNQSQNISWHWYDQGGKPSPNATTAYDGSNRASRINETAATDMHYVWYGNPVYATNNYTYSIMAIRGPDDTRAINYAGNVLNSTYVYAGQITLGDNAGTYNATNVYPEANFTASAYSGVSPLSVNLYDNTTPSEIVGWNWYAINQSNSSPEYTIESTQNPTHIFGEGNWTVKLKASNYLYSGNSSSKWINVSLSGESPPEPPSYCLDFAPVIDGYAAQTTDGSWATMRGGAGEASASGATVAVKSPYEATESNSASTWIDMNRAILSFNTSTIQDDATLVKATPNGNNPEDWFIVKSECDGRTKTL